MTLKEQLERIAKSTELAEARRVIQAAHEFPWNLEDWEHTFMAKNLRRAHQYISDALNHAEDMLRELEPKKPERDDSTERVIFFTEAQLTKHVADVMQKVEMEKALAELNELEKK